MIRGEKIRDVLARGGPREGVTICGWARSMRGSKAVGFLVISDGSTFATIQVVVNADLPNFAELFKAGTGAAFSVTGNLVPSPGKGQDWELHATEVTVVGTSEPSFPLQKKRHTREYLRTIAHLRLRSNLFGAVFRVRNAAAFAIHKFFQEQGFMWVHTPIVTCSDAEGAGEMFRVTTLDLDNVPRKEDGAVDFSKDFFGSSAGLTVSGQLQAEVFAQAFTDVYTFGPTFRAENSNTARHASEFWMIEPEMAFADLQDDVRLAEAFMKSITAFVLDRCETDLAFFDQWVEKGLVARLEKMANADFEVMTYTEAVAILEQSGEKFEFAPSWGMDLQTEHERYLSEKKVGGPVFVIDYPAKSKAFYMKRNDDDKTVAALDLLVPQVGEIIGGSQREHRLDVLQARMAQFGLSEEEYWWYLDLRRFGTTPHAGFGLGFERTVMYLTGVANIRDVIPFPRTPGNAEF